MRIGLLEDDSAQATLVSDWLTQAGHEHINGAGFDDNNLLCQLEQCTPPVAMVHDGQVLVTTNRGQGSGFRLTLPTVSLRSATDD